MVPCKVKVVEVPGKMTHIYQPADQFVIANLRSRIGKSWEGYVEYTVSTQGAIDAAITMQCEAAFVKREREDAITVPEAESGTNATQDITAVEQEEVVELVESVPVQLEDTSDTEAENISETDEEDACDLEGLRF